MILAGSISTSESIEQKPEKVIVPTRANPATNSGVAGNLEYVKMLKNPYLTARITTPNTDIITGALSEDFGFNLGNKWSPLVPMSSLPLIGDIGQGVAGVLTATAGATQLSFESLWMTSASWTGSEMPTFPVSLAFLNYTSSAHIISKMLGVASGALTPSISYDAKQAGVAEDAFNTITGLQETVSSGAVNMISSVGAWAESLMTKKEVSAEDYLSSHSFFQNIATALNHSSQWAIAAPCNYGLEPDTNLGNAAYKPKKNTTFALEIGKWFKANQLLINSIGVRFSKEVAPNGSPLIMHLDVNFRPYRNITYKKFCSYFNVK